MGQVVSQSELILHRGEWKRNGKGVVCASGCFDLLHPGHIRLLEQARSLGDILVVAVQSDSSVRAGRSAVKGVARPVTPAAERMEILAALAAVDYVVVFDETSPQDLLARLAPDVVVKGGDPGSDQLAFQADEATRAAGGEVVRIPLEPGHSTARLIERIAQLRA